MKKYIVFFAVMAIVCTITLKAFSKQNVVNVSDVVLANVEALATPETELPEVELLCSEKCTDGIGRCWLKSGGNFCVFSGSKEDNCTGYGCKLSDGSIYY